MSDEVAPLRRKPAEPSCPICGKPSERRFAPFCSDRCRLVDLSRWFGGTYVVPGPPAAATPADDEEEGG